MTLCRREPIVPIISNDLMALLTCNMMVIGYDPPNLFLHVIIQRFKVNPFGFSKLGRLLPLNYDVASYSTPILSKTDLTSN